jgi:hypothetical protein
LAASPAYATGSDDSAQRRTLVAVDGRHHLDGHRPVQHVQAGGGRFQQGRHFSPQRFDPVRRQLPVVDGKTERLFFHPGAGIGR